MSEAQQIVSNRNWEALREHLQKVDADRARTTVDITALRGLLAEMERRNTALEQRVNTLQIRIMTGR